MVPAAVAFEAAFDHYAVVVVVVEVGEMVPAAVALEAVFEDVRKWGGHHHVGGGPGIASVCETLPAFVDIASSRERGRIEGVSRRSPPRR